MIRAVIFDYGGVISDFDTRTFLRAIAPSADRSVEELRDLIYRSDLPARYESGALSSRDFFAEVSRRCGLRMSEADFVDAFTGIFSPIGTTLALIRALAGRYRLGLLSNTNEWHFERHIRHIDVFPLFEAVTLSYRVGEMKPGERIYRDALEKLGLPAERCAYVDDLDENVAGARRLGISGVRYTGHRALVEALRGLDVGV